MEPELNINDLWKVWQWDEKVEILLLLLALDVLVFKLSSFGICQMWFVSVFPASASGLS